MPRLCPAKAMRERSQDSQAGLALYVGLFGHLGMLHRAKYSRFRNESITSLDEVSPGGSVGNKGSTPPPHPALAPHLPAEDAVVPTQESPTALCTLIPRMASMKLANPITFLSLKTFCLGTKEVPRQKLQENQDQSNPPSPEFSLHRTEPAPTSHPDQVGRRLTSLPSEICPLPGPGEQTLRSKQDRHALQHLLGTGLNYCVRVSPTGLLPEHRQKGSYALRRGRAVALPCWVLVCKETQSWVNRRETWPYRFPTEICTRVRPRLLRGCELLLTRRQL